MFRTMRSQKRLFGLIAMAVGLIAGLLILLDATSARVLSLLSVGVGLGVLYGSYLIYRGKTSLLFGWGQTRVGAWINLILGVLTLIVPGGVGGIASILAILSGILGLLSA